MFDTFNASLLWSIRVKGGAVIATSAFIEARQMGAFDSLKLSIRKITPL